MSTLYNMQTFHLALIDRGYVFPGVFRLVYLNQLNTWKMKISQINSPLFPFVFFFLFFPFILFSSALLLGDYAAQEALCSII